MKTKKIRWALLLTSTLLAQGCAHTRAERALDEKLSHEEAVADREALRAKAGDEIESAQGLSDDQRVRLMALRDAVGLQMDALVAKSMKLRAVLIKDVISTSYDMDEVDLIRTRLRDLENERITLMFTAIEDANQILDRGMPNKPAVIHHYFNFDSTSGRKLD